ncbi:hypothetical protein LIER_24023 [Lithospermum erythrorhizon]|uniref:Transposase (putative) gypsy type domain-containing protein n=1 Tax=Lithospermum erythrorhizon TaxID=34254 RepID=A0AAV3R5A9_LITER
MIPLILVLRARVTIVMPVVLISPTFLFSQGLGRQQGINTLPSHPLTTRPHSSSHHSPQSKAIRANLPRCGSELSETDLVDLRSRYDIPSSVMLLRPGPIGRATTPPPGMITFFVVALINGMRLPIHPYIGEVLSLAGVGTAQLTPNMWLSIIEFYSACLLAGMTPTTEFFLTSFSQGTQKDDFLYFTARPDMKGFCEAFSSKVEPNTWRPFFSMLPVMVCLTTFPLAAGLFPITDVDLGILEALRVSFSVLDHMPLSPPAVAPNRLPLRHPTPEPVVVNSSSEEDEAMSPLLRRPHSSALEASARNPQEAVRSPRAWGPPLLATPALAAAQENVSGQYSATVVLEPKDQGGVGSATSQTPSSVGSPLANSRPSQLPRRSVEVPPSSSSTAPNHAELISSLASLGDKDLISSYEAASGFSSRVDQLEGELKALKDEKAQEVSVLRCRLKTQANEYSILQERYGASVRAEAVSASLEGVQTERDSAVKERETLRAGRDEMLQTHDRLLDQLIESQRQAQVMKVTLESIRTTDSLGELV